MNVIGRCPDCAAEIWEGHVTHVCLPPDAGVVSRSSYDLIRLPNGGILSGSMTTYPMFELPVPPPDAT